MKIIQDINTTNYTDPEKMYRLGDFLNGISAYALIQGGGEAKVIPQVCLDQDYASWADVGEKLTIEETVWLTPQPLTGIRGFRLRPIDENINWNLFVSEFYDTRYRSF